MYNEIMGKATTRPYRKRKRAESEEETRRRITEAAVELHGTAGPARTTVTEIAELAGVSRMTVYNHFPTDTDLFIACSTHWSTENPFPDPAAWTQVADPAERLSVALQALYRWYDDKRGMLANVLRDAPAVPALTPLVERWWGGYMDAVVDTLSDGWRAEGGVAGALRVTLRVVVDFHTWQIFSASGMDDDEAAEFAAGMVARSVEAITA
jgi:AcrR family transcriptional regulator